MFFLIERKDTLALHPKYFGKNVEKEILEQLKLKVEGKCSGRFGYTIVVTNMQEIGKGELHPVSVYSRLHSLIFCHSVRVAPSLSLYLPGSVFF